jgi:ribosome maturation factor RimP
MTDAEERLWGMIEPYVAAEGVQLDDIELAGGGRLLRVVLDADGGIGVDRIAELSRGISRVVDTDDPIDTAYTLEVSSPGLERKLRRPAQFIKSIGRQLKVKTAGPIDGERNHRGTLVAADEHGFTIDQAGHEVRFGYGDVASAKTVFVWDTSRTPAEKA